MQKLFLVIMTPQAGFEEPDCGNLGAQLFQSTSVSSPEPDLSPPYQCKANFHGAL